jgi:hypothetical protein
MLILLCIAVSAFLCNTASGGDTPAQQSQTSGATIRLEYQKQLTRVLPAFNKARGKTGPRQPSLDYRASARRAQHYGR